MVYGCYEPNKEREVAECVYINQRQKSTFFQAMATFIWSLQQYITHYNTSCVLYDPAAITAIPLLLTFNRVGSFFTAQTAFYIQLLKAVVSLVNVEEDTRSTLDMHVYISPQAM